MPGYDGKPNHSTHKRSLSRVVSRETSKPNSSCRVYYGEAAGAVPFLWESHPGTPKHPLFDQPSSLIPPLTPPPSFAAGAAGSGRSVGGSGKRRDFKPRLDLFVSSILTRASRSRTGGTSFSSSSSSASWSSHGSARDGYSGEIPARSMRSPTSTLCFPAVKKSAWRMVSGCYTASMNVKNAGKIRA